MGYRILVSSLSRDFGGVESIFLNFCKQKDSLNTLDFVCWDSNAAREEEFTATGAKVFHLPRPGKKLREYTKVFKSILENGNYQIYHVNLTRFRFPIDAIIAKKMGLKVVLHCHSTQIYKTGQKKTDIIRRIEQFVFKPIWLNCSDVNIACSKTAGEYLFHNCKYRILYNGINLNQYEYKSNCRRVIRQQMGFDEDCIVLGHIGRFSEEKNHYFLLNVFQRLIEKDYRYRMICVGQGNLFDKVKEYSIDLGISDKVYFCGQRSDISELLSAMDIFVFPSRHEAFPMTLIEAQANGLKCFVSSVVTPEIDPQKRISFLPITDEKIWVKEISEYSKCCKRKLESEKIEIFEINKMYSSLMNIYGPISP